MKEEITYKNETFTASKPVFASKGSNVVKLFDIPSDVNEDTLELLLENSLGGDSFSKDPVIDINRLNNTARVTFESVEGQWICGRH